MHMCSVSNIFESNTDSEEEFFGFTADDISSRADTTGESDISADERSNKSSTEEEESDSSWVESGDEEEWSDNLAFVIVEDFNKSTRPTTVLPATATANAGDFFNLVFPEDLIQLIIAETNRNAQCSNNQELSIKIGYPKQWRHKAFFAIRFIQGINSPFRGAFLVQKPNSQ